MALYVKDPEVDKLAERLVARILKLPLSQASAAVEDYLKLAGITVIPVAPQTRALALDAYERYGTSRHPAALNFGDCFAYACARHEGVRLLYKGDDFFPHRHRISLAAIDNIFAGVG
jgi:ribonuclease VapC